MKHFCQKCRKVFKAPRGRILCDACLLEEQKELKTKAEEDKLNQSLGKEHFELVQQLKQSLILGQLGFLHAGKILSEIKKKQTYRAEDFSREISWQEFCSRPDLPLPTSSRDPASLRRMADRLIQIYELFVEKLQIKEERLAEIGYTKLALIAPALKDKQKEDSRVQEWLDKALLLTRTDLASEIRLGGKTLGEIFECTHPPELIEEIRFWRCKSCGATWKNDPYGK